MFCKCDMICNFSPIAGNRFRCIRCGFITPPMRIDAARIRRKCHPGKRPAELPPTATQAARYLSAIERWRLAGRPERTDDEVREILETYCVACEHFEAGRCTHHGCGCNVRTPEEEQATLLGRYVHRGLVNKLRQATESCPVGRWFAVRRVAHSGPIRVAIATPVFLCGGAEQWIALLCRWLDPKRARVVRVIVTGQLPIDQTARAWLPAEIELRQEATIVDDGAFDVLVTWGQDDLVAATQQFFGPLIDVQHGVSLVDGWQAPLVRQAEAAHRRLGTVIAAVSEEARANFSGDLRDRLVVLENGADPARIEPRGEPTVDLPPGAKVALFVGRIAAEKNVQALVDAVGWLNWMGEPWHAVLVGNRHHPLVRLNDRIHLVGPRANVGDFLAIADVMVHPAHFESHCLAINEAWLAGLPVVSCDYGVNRRFQERHGPMMWTVPVNPTAEQLGREILRADRNDPRVERARKVAEGYYTAEAMGRRWADLICRVAGR